mgnify:CR=1 FL=1
MGGAGGRRVTTTNTCVCLVGGLLWRYGVVLGDGVKGRGWEWWGGGVGGWGVVGWREGGGGGEGVKGVGGGGVGGVGNGGGGGAWFEEWGGVGARV